MSEAIFSLSVVVLMLIVLVLEIYEPVIVFFAALTVFVIAGIIDIEGALVGLTNEGTLTIAALFIIMGALQRNNNLLKVTNKLFGKNTGGRKSLLKVIAPVTALSGFMNNTPLVAVFLPLVRNWAIENKVSPSKYLLPLSYASIFGGLLTVIGTSTNVVVSGLLQKQGEAPFSMFEIGYVGLPLAIIGLVYLLTFGYKILPNNEDLIENFKKQQKDYLVTMRVEASCQEIGKNITQAGLRNLKGLFLFEIVRKGEVIAPVNPAEIIHEGDKLVFTGDIKTIGQLQAVEGLCLETDSEESFEVGVTQIVEAVVSDNFPYLGKTIKESNFRSRYDAAVVAVLRNGERIKEKLGSVKLKPGDTILMLAGKSFFSIWGASKDFYLTSKVGDLAPVENKRGGFILILFLVMILLAAFNLVSILEGAFFVVLILLLTKTTTLKEARKSIQWNTLMLIAFSFGLGDALNSSGATSLLARGLIASVGAWGPVGLIVSVYIFTNILTELLSNSAAAALVFPIAYSAALQMGVDPHPVAITVAIAASAGFATPIGYQTNLMVFGPGGYKFRDFIKIGLPLNIIFMVVAVVLIPLIWDL